MDASQEPAPAPTRPPGPPPENLWINLLCNVLLPGLIMSKLSSPERLGPVWALVLGVSLPLGYGIYDLVRRRKWNLFSGVGLVSVGLTGGLGLYKASTMAFAIKEASVPAVFALAVLATLRSRRPLVREMILNESVIDLPKVDDALDAHNSRQAFEDLLKHCTWLLAGSFALSAALNFLLARLFLTGEPGTSEFTEQLGRMNLWSWPVIMVPSMAILVVALLKLLRGIHRLTGLKLEEILQPHHRKPGK